MFSPSLYKGELKMKNTSKLLFGFLAVLFVTACGSKEVKPTIMTNGCPAWTMQGTASFNDGNIYGVGSVFNVRNPSLARGAADTRARAEIVRTLKSKVSDLMKDYQASTSAGEAGVSSEEQDITMATKAFAEMELNGTVVVDRCNGSDGGVYSLVKLDPASVEKVIDQQKTLSPKLKAIVKENAAKAFEEINAESAKI